CSRLSPLIHRTYLFICSVFLKPVHNISALAGEKRELLLVRSYQLLILYRLNVILSNYFLSLISSISDQRNSSLSNVFCDSSPYLRTFTSFSAISLSPMTTW